MEKMKKNKLALALTATLGLGAFAGAAQAVNVASDGIGAFSYIPYFSVAKGQEEYIKLVNTSAKTVAVKIAFRRGTDSLEVRDFNIIMSPYDVWVAKVVPSTNGNAKVVTSDKTCTSPDKNQWTPEAGGAYSVDFDTTRFGSNVSISSLNVLPGFVSSLVKDIKEGYVAVTVMGVSNISTNVPGSVAFLAKHQGGTPRDCQSIDSGFANVPFGALASIISQFWPAENVLRTTSSLVDVKAGTAVEIPVTTFANTDLRASIQGVNHIHEPSTDQPEEAINISPISDIFVDGTRTHARGGFPVNEGARAISSTIMTNSVVGTYDTTNNQTTNWIVNFPTKKALMDLFPAVQPFKDSVVQIAKSTFDEEEETSTSTTRFSPALTKTVTLPWEVNVVGFSNNNSLTSGLFTDAGQGFAKGWMSLTFPTAVIVTADELDDAASAPTGNKVTYTGMPVIGFEMNEGNGIAASAPLSSTKGILISPK